MRSQWSNTGRQAAVQAIVIVDAVLGQDQDEGLESVAELATPSDGGKETHAPKDSCTGLLNIRRK